MSPPATRAALLPSADGRHTALPLRDWSLRLLVTATWISGAVFGLYILLFFGGTWAHGEGMRWNESLPALHDPATPLSTLAIGLHFAAGGVLLVLGPVQLIGRLRRALPALHRWLGRLYVLGAALAGVAGLAFILAKGTIGGTLMDLGFGLYGALMVICAGLAFAHARARRLDQHRVWAIRLFALTIGSWLYRMEYGLWFMVMGPVGHTPQFDGGFDAVMMFFFYLPNLLIAELVLGSRHSTPSSRWHWVSAGVFLAAAVFVAVATWFFARHYWWPGIVAGATGSPL